MSERCACTENLYFCGVAFATDIENVERRFALKRRNLVNFNHRGAIVLAFRPAWAWTAFMILLYGLPEPFFRNIKVGLRSFCVIAQATGEAENLRVGGKVIICAMTKGNSSFGAGKQAGYDEGYADAKKDFKNVTGKDFDEVFNRGKIAAIIYGNEVDVFI